MVGILRKVILKAIETANKVDASDVFVQSNTSDLIQLLKDFLL